jgi:hypothetical protein
MRTAFLVFFFLAALGIAAGHLAEASYRPGSGVPAAAPAPVPAEPAASPR